MIKATTFTLACLAAMSHATQTTAELEALKLQQMANFDKFCKKFHKEYKTTADFNAHLEQFVINSAHFAKKNAKQNTKAHFGSSNEVGADLSPEEFEKQMLGAIVTGLVEEEAKESE